jgi:tetratricopeptide (TPR) repeat protein
MTASVRRYELALEIGEEAVRQKQWQQALTCFQTALNGLPRESRAYAGLGDTHLALADLGRALACYKEAARLAGDNPIYTEKVAALQERLGMIPDAARSYQLTGDILWNQQQFDPAAASWKQALALQGDRLGAHERLAMDCQRRGDTLGAARHYLALAHGLRQLGRYLMALHVCCTALTALPENRMVWEATEETWRYVATRDRRAYYRAVHVEPGDLLKAATDFAQWQLTAEFRQSTLRRDAAQRAARDTYLRQAMLHEGRGLAGPAIIAYEKAIAAGLNLPAAFFALGLLYRLVGRRGDARAALLLASRHPFYRRAVALLE